VRREREEHGEEEEEEQEEEETGEFTDFNCVIEKHSAGTPIEIDSSSSVIN